MRFVAALVAGTLLTMALAVPWLLLIRLAEQSSGQRQSRGITCGAVRDIGGWVSLG